MKSFDHKWEKVYRDSDSKHLNRYPYGQLVTTFYRNKWLFDSGRQTRVLELGCGVGNNLPVFLNEGYEVYGVDGSHSALSLAQNNLTRGGYNCGFAVMDLGALSFSDGYFDLLVDRQAIYANRTADIERIFSEVARVLKGQGILISFLYNINDFHYIQARKHGIATKIEDQTYDDFREGTFEATGIVHFFCESEVRSVCARHGLEIVSLAENQINQLLPNEINVLSEFILVAKNVV